MHPQNTTPEQGYPTVPRCPRHDRLLDVVDGEVEPCDLCQFDLLLENEAS